MTQDKERGHGTIGTAGSRPTMAGKPGIAGAILASVLGEPA